MQKIKDEINEKRNINRIKEEYKKALNYFCIESEVENIKTESQNIYSAFCMFAGQQVFINDFFVVGTKNNKYIYDLFLIDEVANFYIFFCSLYNKIPSLIDFSYFINIDYNIINGWRTDTQKQVDFNQTQKDLHKLYILSYNSIENYNIYKNKLITCEGEVITIIKASIFYKLHLSREEALKNALIVKNNPVGLISIVNKEYKWNIEQTKEEIQIKALTLQELPQIQALLDKKQ